MNALCDIWQERCMLAACDPFCFLLLRTFAFPWDAKQAFK
jgi:hypothetical protein